MPTAAAPLLTTVIRFPDNYPITSGSPAGLSSIRLGQSVSGGERIDLTISREGFPVDTAFIGPQRGGIALSPFRFERQGGDMIINFSRPVDTFAVRMGDFGADSPDRLSLRAYASPNGSGRLLAASTSALPTEPPGTRTWNERRLSVRAPGIQSIRMIGGTPQFPHSVFYNDFHTSFTVPSVAKTRLTKAALAVGKGAGGARNAASAVKMGLKAAATCGAAAKPPITVLTGGLCLTSTAATAGYIHKTGTAVHDIRKILDDPPRFDYNELADLRAPNFVAPFDLQGLSEEERGQIIGLLSGFAESRHLYAAWLTTLERYQGAEIAGDSAAMERQFTHLETIISSLSVLTAKNIAGLRYWGERLEAEFGPLVVTEAEAREFFRSIRESGMPDYMTSMLESFGYDERARSLIGEALGSLDVDGDIVVTIASITSPLDELLRNIACVSGGCFIDHRTITIPDGQFELSFDYFNFGSDSLVSLFIDGALFDNLIFSPSGETGPNKLALTLDANDFLTSMISLSFFVNDANPVTIGEISTRQIFDDDTVAIPLPSSISLFGMALVLLAIPFARRVKKPAWVV
jgi:hypothetical protein